MCLVNLKPIEKLYKDSQDFKVKNKEFFHFNPTINRNNTFDDCCIDELLDYQVILPSHILPCVVNSVFHCGTSGQRKFQREF